MAINNTNSLMSEIERLLNADQKSPFALPAIIDRAAQQAASLSVACMLTEEKRDIAESCLDKAIAKSKDPIEIDAQLLEEFAKRIEYYAAQPSERKTTHSIKVKLGDVVTSLSDLEEGAHLVIINQSNQSKSIALVEGIDGSNGVWIRKIKHTKELLSEEKTRLGEPEYVSFGEIKTPSSRLFYQVKEQVKLNEAKQKIVWNVWFECNDTISEYDGVSEIEKAVGKKSGGSGGKGWDCSFHYLKSGEDALKIATKAAGLKFIDTIRIYADDDISGNSVFEKEVRRADISKLTAAVKAFKE